MHSSVRDRVSCAGMIALAFTLLAVMRPATARAQLMASASNPLALYAGYNAGYGRDVGEHLVMGANYRFSLRISALELRPGVFLARDAGGRTPLVFHSDVVLSGAPVHVPLYAFAGASWLRRTGFGGTTGMGIAVGRVFAETRFRLTSDITDFEGPGYAVSLGLRF